MRRVWKHLKKIANDEKASMLLMAYFVIAILLGVGATMFLLANNQARMAERQRLTATAFHIAEAGIERTLYNLRQDVINVSGTMTPDWGDCNINGISISSGCPSTSTYYDLPYADTNFNNGTYSVQLKNDPSGDIWVKSKGTLNDVSHTIEVYVRLVNISPWNNAIFAGSGAAGAMINGNVDIRGSVHILGDGLSPGDFAVDLGGTSELVGNNYSGLDPTLKDKVPALPTTSVNGETVETLNAELRVKKGLVGLSGSATVGEANVDGNGVKEQIDGVYATDGFGGNQGSAAVYSDNGNTNAYDLGNAVQFPSLSDPVNGYSNYRAYLASLGALVVNDPTDLNNLANVTPSSNFTVGDCSTNCISMDGSGNMTVKGVVVIDPNAGAGLPGNLDFEAAGSNKTITYSGTGSIYVSGDVQVNTSLITSGSNSFPTNVVAIMTPKTMDFNQASSNVMGLFYAETQITVQKQTNILGTIVSNYFDMGTNVPAIYQVPETVHSLPNGLISNNAFWYLVVAWIKT